MGLKAKLQSSKENAVNSMIYKSYYDDDIDDNLVYLESRDGLDFTGNIFRIVEELSTGKYGDLKIYVHAKPQAEDKIRAYQKNYNLKIDKIITKEATATRILEKAKYIFTDAGIRPKYVKREGQIFVNTWHGTPLKLMGKDNAAEKPRLANAQHPLLSSDYLLYPNVYMKDKMLNAFMIDKIYSGRILLEGYPRNSVFYKDSWLREKLGLVDKDIFVYMPTFRGVLMDRDDDLQKDDVENYLSQLDARLKDNQILFAKLHVLNESQIDFDKFTHVKPFPEGYETYDVLNMADVLITDYSSVFFDFANTHRKIILFNYDEEEYESYRGFYFKLSDLPFPKVQTIDELFNELNSPISYSDDDFYEKYCEFDNINAASRLCRHIFTDENVCREELIENDKGNILIYAGSLESSDIRMELTKLLDNLDKRKYNLFLTYKQWDEYINENYEDIFNQLSEDIEILPIRFNLTPTMKEKRDYDRYYSSHDSTLPKSLERLFRRSFEKQFSFVKWDGIIVFDVSDYDESLMFTSNELKHCVWVHKDISKENEFSENVKIHILKEICSGNEIYVTSPDLIKPTSSLSGREDNIHVVGYDYAE